MDQEEEPKKGRGRLRGAMKKWFKPKSDGFQELINDEGKSFTA